MIQDTLSFATCFELNNSPKNVEVTDDSPYVAEGIDLADVEGFFTMTGPSGVVFHQGVISPPDIDADASLVFAGAILPLDSNNKVQKGTYTLKYDVTIGGAVQPGNYSVTKIYNFQYVAAVGRIDLVSDCRCSSLTSTDTTSYGTPTSLVRTHTVHPPIGVDPSAFSDTVSPNSVIPVSPITNKTWTSEISTVLQYDFADGLCVKDTVTAAEENTIDCDISLCDIFCCIKTVADNYFAALNPAPFRARQIMDDQLEDIMILASLHHMAIQCGLDKLATGYYNQILAISNCEPGCSCTDDKPTLIVPICAIPGGGGSETVVAECGNGAIEVVLTVLGDVNTYTVCLRQDLKDKLDALFNTVLVAGAGISITPVIAPNGDIEYTIANTSQIQGQSLMRLEIDFTAGTLPAFTILDEKIIGSEFKPSTLDFKNSTNASLYNSQNAEFEVKEFLVAANTFNEIVAIESIEFGKKLNILSVLVSTTTTTTAANGSIKFQFTDLNGIPFSGAKFLKNINKIIVTLNINAL